MDCEFCLKPEMYGHTVCEACVINSLMGTVAELADSDESRSVLDEALSETAIKFGNINKLREGDGSMTNLLKLLSKMGPAAVRLNRGKDDYAVTVCDPATDSAFIGNGEVFVRLSNIPNGFMDGVMSNCNAFDYYQEKFIPSPLPWSNEKVNALYDSTFSYSFSLDPNMLLEYLDDRFPSANTRAGMFVLVSIDMALDPKDEIYTGFTPLDNGAAVSNMYDKPYIVVESARNLAISEMNPTTAYVCRTLADLEDLRYLTAGRRFESTVRLGFLRGNSIMDNQILDIDSYGKYDVYQVPLTSVYDGVDLSTAYIGYEPVIINCEYLYEILTVLAGSSVVNFLINDRSKHIVIENIPLSDDEPKAEAVIAPVLLGVNIV